MTSRSSPGNYETQIYRLGYTVPPFPCTHREREKGRTDEMPLSTGRSGRLSQIPFDTPPLDNHTHIRSRFEPERGKRRSGKSETLILLCRSLNTISPPSSSLLVQASFKHLILFFWTLPLIIHGYTNRVCHADSSQSPESEVQAVTVLFLSIKS